MRKLKRLVAALARSVPTYRITKSNEDMKPPTNARGAALIVFFVLGGVVGISDDAWNSPTYIHR